MTHDHRSYARRTLLRTALAAGAGAGLAATLPATAVARPRVAALPRLCVGGYDVMALVDATGPFFLAPDAAFSGAEEADWARARRIDPGAFGDDGSWVLDFRCFLIRRPGGRLALVDTGVGPVDSPAAPWAPVPGRLPEALREAGVDTADVDTVVLTHLHEDHYGWSVDESGAPSFPHARYVVQQRELDLLPADSSAWSYVVDPLRGAGLLDTVDGGRRLWRRGGTVALVPTPGHTPGHQSVLVEARDREVILTGDVLVHAVQLADPAVSYSFEEDPETARRTRTALLAYARKRGALLGSAHMRRAFVRA